MQTIVKETTVYSLAELQEQFGERVYEDALSNVYEWVWEGFEPEIVTEDMAYMIGEDYPLFELAQTSYRTGNGKTGYRPDLYWDMNPYSAEAKGSVDVARFMAHFKLRRKYALLHTLMSKYGLNLSAPCSFGSGRSKEVDLSDLQSDIEYEDDTEYQSPRYYKIVEQIDALEKEIEDYIGQIYSFVLKHLRDEEDYRSSEEYAKEEAEAAELQFTESGCIYHG